MELKIYAIYDSVAKVFKHPQFYRTRGEALRSFMLGVNDSQPNELSKFPQEFSLFEVGSFDDISGFITPQDKPFNLGLAAQFKNVVPEGNIGIDK